MEIDGVGGGEAELQRSGSDLPSFRFDEDEDSDGELNRYVHIHVCFHMLSIQFRRILVWGSGT